MPAITLNTVVTDTNLPLALNYDVLIGERPELLGWWVPDVGRVTLASGRVQAIAPRGTNGKVASQATVGRQPLWNAAGAPSSRPSMTFDNARVDYLGTNAVLPTGASAKFTKVVLIKAPSEPTSNVYHDVLSGSTIVNASTGIHRLAVRGVDVYINLIGSAAGTASRTVAATPAAWAMVMGVWDGTTGIPGISVNGAAFTFGSAVPAAQCTDSVLNIGYGGNVGTTFIGEYADAMVFNVDLSAGANTALRAIVNQYYRDRYEMAVS